MGNSGSYQVKRGNAERAFHLAVLKNDMAKARAFLDQGVRIDRRWDGPDLSDNPTPVRGDTPLLTAVYHDHVEMIQVMMCKTELTISKSAPGFGEIVLNS